MNIALKVLCGLFALMMAAFGARWWFSFGQIAQEWSVEAPTALGTNNLTADMGALFFGSAIMIALGLRSGKSFWLLAAALLMLIAAAGRLYAFATVGYVTGAMPALVVEILSAALLAFTHSRLKTA